MVAYQGPTKIHPLCPALGPSTPTPLETMAASQALGRIPAYRAIFAQKHATSSFAKALIPSGFGAYNSRGPPPSSWIVILFTFFGFPWRSCRPYQPQTADNPASGHDELPTTLTSSHPPDDETQATPCSRGSP